MDICGKQMTLTVTTATLQIIDGFEVNVDGEVVGPNGTRKHEPKCLFETSSDHTDASLMQQDADSKREDPTSGLVGTVTMQTDLCKADEEDGPGASFEQQVFFGELSRYKGYEHVNAELPRIHVKLEEGAPAEMDFRKTYPKCYRLENGKEAVRNQAQ